MPEYTPVTRAPAGNQSSSARARRFVHAFQLPGSGTYDALTLAERELISELVGVITIEYGDLVLTGTLTSAAVNTGNVISNATITANAVNTGNIISNATITSTAVNTGNVISNATITSVACNTGNVISNATITSVTCNTGTLNANSAVIVNSNATTLIVSGAASSNSFNTTTLVVTGNTTASGIAATSVTVSGDITTATLVANTSITVGNSTLSSSSARVFGTSVEANTDHGVSGPEYLVLVTSGAASKTVTLPTASSYINCIIHVKKVDGGAGAAVVQGAGLAGAARQFQVGEVVFNVDNSRGFQVKETVICVESVAGGTRELIDGVGSKTIANAYGSISVASDGQEWHIVSEVLR